MPSAGDVRAVVDTNVLLSGLFWRGRPHALMEQARTRTLTSVTHELLADPRWRRGPGSDAGYAP